MSKRLLRFLPLSLVGLLAAGLLGLPAGRAAAQDYPPPDNQAPQPDPPGRVGRLNFVRGAVSFQAAGEAEWVTADPNRPITTGDSLWADENSGAEVHIGSTAIRLAARTGITFLEINDQLTQLRLAQGSVIVNLRHFDDPDAFEIDTPNLAFSLLRTGEYRLDVSDDGTQSTATVWRGQGSATGGGRSFPVVAGQRATFTGSGTEALDFDFAQIARPDAFERWAFDRDKREDRAESSNYVSREVTGYEDLDDYGTWQYAGEYGPVWAPRVVPVGWAPYRYGHWVFIAPWGWTWVDEQPWGFAPFHYGRWAYFRGGWVWVPGPVVVRPVYAPALVVFVGGGGGVFAVAGGPGVGWFPLGPGEVFVPAYRTSRVYVNNVNITNTRVEVTRITHVYNIYNTPGGAATRVTYINQQTPNAVTVVSRETFVGARPVARNTVQVSREEIARASVTPAVGVAPVQASVHGTAPARSAPPPAIRSRMVIANRMPSAAPPARGGSQGVEPGPSVRPSPNRPAGPEQSRGAAQEPAPLRVPQPVSPGNAPAPAAQPAPPPPPQQVRPAPGQAPAQPNAQPPAQPAQPNVQLAPPVREKSEAESREEQRKFDTWQQQRQQQQQQQQQQPARQPSSQAQPPQQQQQKSSSKPPADKSRQQDKDKEKSSSGKPPA